MARVSDFPLDDVIMGLVINVANQWTTIMNFPVVNGTVLLLNDNGKVKLDIQDVVPAQIVAGNWRIRQVNNSGSVTKILKRGLMSQWPTWANQMDRDQVTYWDRGHVIPEGHTLEVQINSAVVLVVANCQALMDAQLVEDMLGAEMDAYKKLSDI